MNEDVSTMTEKSLKAERDRLKLLLNNEEITPQEAVRLREVKIALGTIDRVRPGFGW